MEFQLPLGHDTCVTTCIRNSELPSDDCAVKSCPSKLLLFSRPQTTALSRAAHRKPSVDRRAPLWCSPHRRRTRQARHESRGPSKSPAAARGSSCQRQALVPIHAHAHQPLGRARTAEARRRPAIPQRRSQRRRRRGARTPPPLVPAEATASVERMGGKSRVAHKHEHEVRRV